jgi:5-methylcytosine-specific restriction endonuclease McrA
MAGLSKEYGYWTDQPKSAYSVEYYRVHREQLKDAARQHYHATRDRAAARYQARRVEIAARNRATREVNGKALQAACRTRYANNPAPAIARANKRRAIRLTAGIGTDRAAYRAFVKHVRSADVIACRWCAEPVAKAERRIDHIIPLARGGSDDVANLCCACRLCNARKGHKMPEDFQPENTNTG